MTQRNPCWICTGRSRSLCAKHKRAATERAAKLKITREAAAFDLRDFELAVQEKRIDARRVASQCGAPALSSQRHPRT